MASSAPVELQKYLGGIDYPASKDELVRRARSNGADDDLVGRLSSIPERQYDGPNAVSAEFARAR